MTSGRKQTSKVFEANNKHKRTFRRLFEVLQKIRTYSLRTLEVALKNRHLLEDFTSASRRTEYSKDFQVAIDILLFDVLYPCRHRVQVTETMRFFYQILKKHGVHVTKAMRFFYQIVKKPTTCSQTIIMQINEFVTCKKAMTKPRFPKMVRGHIQTQMF